MLATSGVATRDVASSGSVDEETKARVRQAAATRDAQIKRARTEYDQAIANELLNGVLPGDMAEFLGVHYETVRRLARRCGVPLLRDPTVTSRRPNTEG